MSSTPTECIYRASKKLGLACRELSVHDTPFCKSHRKCGNAQFFQDAANFMKGSPSGILSADNVYSCMDALWTSLNTKKSDLNSAFVAVEVITHLCDHPHIMLIGKTLKIHVRAPKMPAAFDIVSVMWEVWHFGRNESATRALIQVQRKWRARRVHSLRGPYPELRATNDVDPFTMDALSDLPPESIFSYWERSAMQWRVYAFSGVEFHDYVYVHDNYTNPLTRAVIPYGVLDRLDKWHKLTQTQQPPQLPHEQPVMIRQSATLPLPPDYSPTASYSNNIIIQPSAPIPISIPTMPDAAEYVSPSIAFTHIASLLESIHDLYIQPQWLSGLTDLSMVSVFAQFHIAVDPVSPQTRGTYMRRPVPVDNIRGYFASEMTALVQQERPPSFLVCSLICVIARYCTPLHASIPNWVFDAADM